MSSGIDQATSSRTEIASLTLDEYKRYGRQMIMPDWGLPGQLRLKAAKVAVVGAGGLGCPVLQYLAGAGVGTISIFDHDTVSVSNLHRQVLHTTERVGMNKAESACLALKALNHHINPVPIAKAVTPSSAINLLRTHDVLIDCTDQPLTRYLLSDAALILAIPLVSGAAIASAGQWAVYAGISRSGKRRPCYRCLWPEIVPGPGNARCDEQGVWGVVTGMVGTAMAGEVIKLLIGMDEGEPLLHLLHLGENPLIRTVRMRTPSTKCMACGEEAVITEDLEAGAYEAFCPGTELNHDTGGERMSAVAFADVLNEEKSQRERTLVVDTRSPVEYAICALPHSTNIPLSTILSDPGSVPQSNDLIFLCRRGQDSQLAAAAISSQSPTMGRRVRDVIGGLEAWSRDVDPEFPIY